MQADLYNKKGSKEGVIDISERVFNCEWNADLVHQALRTQTINRRRPWAHAKDRSEVRGGGKKPWRQKGTGRARHGSIRSPIWKGGGVTHGPSKDRVFTLKINKKMRQKAMFSILSRRFKDGEVKIVENMEIAEPKTKLLADELKNLAPTQNVLIVTRSEDNNLFKAASNLPKVSVIDARSLNVYDLLRHAVVLIERGVLATIDEHYHANK
ncbi:MAG: 50S ribosomal protein L4 [Patescibacteria group bacterium]